jgi:hypothetical protein
MSQVMYMVVASLPDDRTADEYVVWLRAGHVAQVVRAGAASGVVVRLEPDALGKARVMTQYVFPSRAEFDRYCSDDAPKLRADGLRRFPPERGISFERSIGAIVGT